MSEITVIHDETAKLVICDPSRLRLKVGSDSQPFDVVFRIPSDPKDDCGITRIYFAPDRRPVHPELAADELPALEEGMHFVATPFQVKSLRGRTDRDGVAFYTSVVITDPLAKRSPTATWHYRVAYIESGVEYTADGVIVVKNTDHAVSQVGRPQVGNEGGSRRV
ncbi:MAG: hypothetical protein AAGC55_16270 [Myxococcota bacterium]